MPTDIDSASAVTEDEGLTLFLVGGVLLTGLCAAAREAKRKRQAKLLLEVPSCAYWGPPPTL